MTGFQERFGGLFYRVLGNNPMEYGVDVGATVHDTPFGRAFPGILDGDWTTGLDVLFDGRTAMGPGRWPYRVIDRSVEQRIERHALLVSMLGRFHRTFECHTPANVPPILDDGTLPPPVPEASGPAEMWWSGGDVAVQATLAGWPPGRDRWIIRFFAGTPLRTAEANPIVYGSTAHETVPALWCTLCSLPAPPGTTCVRLS